MDFFITIGGIVYGAALIYSFFFTNKLTELLRVDTLFMPNASEKTRGVNIVAGLLALGYSAYALYRDYLSK